MFRICAVGDWESDDAGGCGAYTLYLYVKSISWKLYFLLPISIVLSVYILFLELFCSRNKCISFEKIERRANSHDLYHS